MSAAVAGRDSGTGDLERSVLEGLEQTPKRVASKWLYDALGSRLFDAICELDAYYPTRTETRILAERAAELAPVVPAGAALVELGSGSSTKTRLVLDALPSLRTYVPIDVSASHLHAAAAAIAADYPRLVVQPFVDDFTRPLVLPAALEPLPKLVFFPGSTIGNFTAPEAQTLLEALGRLDGIAAAIIGVDLQKDPGRLIRAYDDEEGVTAAFNRNLLVRLNRELAATFDLDTFTHEARWNAAQSRIEMHLVSTKAQTVMVAGHPIPFAAGETIHTENSHKYTTAGFTALAADAGWHRTAVWTDAEQLFTVFVLKPKPAPAT